MQLLFPPVDPGLHFTCKRQDEPCNGTTTFVVHTVATVLYASCPVCGSVCEYEPTAVVKPLPFSQPRDREPGYSDKL